MRRLFIIIIGLFLICMHSSYGYPQDSDGDGILDTSDNCPTTANGPELGSCVAQFVGIVIRVGGPCTSQAGCAPGTTCQMQQADMNANGIGDVCECYADGNHDGKVNLVDFVSLKADYNRNDCSPVQPCQSDYNADGKVNLQDLGICKREFARTGCPIPQ